jgi:hypothetical protein
MSEQPASSGATTAATAPQVLGYATPFSAAMAATAWREGMVLVTSRNAELPAVCVKCNAPADGLYERRKYYWYPALLVLLILFNLLIFAIVALLVRKKAEVRVGLCRRHADQRFRLMALAWVLALGGVAAMVGGIWLQFELRNDAWAISGLFVMFAMFVAAVITGFAARILVPQRITRDIARFKGCGVAFLEQLPSTR